MHYNQPDSPSVHGARVVARSVQSGMRSHAYGLQLAPRRDGVDSLLGLIEQAMDRNGRAGGFRARVGCRALACSDIGIVFWAPLGRIHAQICVVIASAHWCWCKQVRCKQVRCKQVWCKQVWCKQVRCKQVRGSARSAPHGSPDLTVTRGPVILPTATRPRMSYLLSCAVGWPRHELRRARTSVMQRRPPEALAASRRGKHELGSAPLPLCLGVRARRRRAGALVGPEDW